MTGVRLLGVDAAGRAECVGIVIDDSGFVASNVGPLSSLIDWAEPITTIGDDILIGGAIDS